MFFRIFMIKYLVWKYGYQFFYTFALNILTQVAMKFEKKPFFLQILKRKQTFQSSYSLINFFCQKIDRQQTDVVGNLIFYLSRNISTEMARLKFELNWNFLLWGKDLLLPGP